MKKHVVKTFITLFLAAVCVSGIFAGGKSEPTNSETVKKTVELTIFIGHGDMEKGTSEIISEYEKLNPNVKITAIYNSKDYATQFQSMIASNSLPDIALVMKQNITEYTKSELFLDLSDRPAAKLLFDIAKEPNSLNGKLYAVPFHLQGYGLLYNPDLLQKAGITQPPQTLIELKNACEKLKTAGITPFASMIKEQWACGQYLLFGISPILAKNPSMVDDINSGKMSFNSPSFLKVFDYIDIMKNNDQDDPMNYAFGESAAYFGQEKAAMAIHGEWILRTALDVNPNLKMKISGIPYSENPIDSMVITGTADGIGIVKSSKNLEEAKKFFDYYTTVQSGQIMSKYNHALVPMKGFDASLLHPVYQDILKMMEAGKSVGWEWVKLKPSSVKESDISIQAYMNGSLSKEQVLQNVENAIDLAR